MNRVVNQRRVPKLVLASKLKFEGDQCAKSYLPLTQPQPHPPPPSGPPPIAVASSRIHSTPPPPPVEAPTLHAPSNQTSGAAIVGWVPPLPPRRKKRGSSSSSATKQDPTREAETKLQDSHAAGPPIEKLESTILRGNRSVSGAG